MLLVQVNVYWLLCCGRSPCNRPHSTGWILVLFFFYTSRFSSGLISHCLSCGCPGRQTKMNTPTTPLLHWTGLLRFPLVQGTSLSFSLSLFLSLSLASAGPAARGTNIWAVSRVRTSSVTVGTRQIFGALSLSLSLSFSLSPLPPPSPPPPPRPPLSSSTRSFSQPSAATPREPKDSSEPQSDRWLYENDTKQSSCADAVTTCCAVYCAHR